MNYTIDTSHYKCPNCRNILLTDKLLICCDPNIMVCPDCGHRFKGKDKIRQAVKEYNKEGVKC